MSWRYHSYLKHWHSKGKYNWPRSNRTVEMTCPTRICCTTFFLKHHAYLIIRVWSHGNVVFHFSLPLFLLSLSYFLLLSSVALSGECCNSYMCVAFTTLINQAFVLQLHVPALSFWHKIVTERQKKYNRNTLWAIKPFLTSLFTAIGSVENEESHG